MNSEAVRDTIIKSLRGQGALSPEHEQALANGQDIELSSLSIDSVNVFTLCMDLEDAVGREIKVGELVENSTIMKLAKHLSAETTPSS
jgi:acyl carrier protein